jgi:hypothetical protein
LKLFVFEIKGGGRKMGLTSQPSVAKLMLGSKAEISCIIYLNKALLKLEENFVKKKISQFLF